MGIITILRLQYIFFTAEIVGISIQASMENSSAKRPLHGECPIKVTIGCGWLHRF